MTQIPAFWKVCLRAVIDVWEKYWNKHLNMDANLTVGPISFLYRNGWKCLKNVVLTLLSIIKGAEVLMKYCLGIILIMALKNRF